MLALLFIPIFFIAKFIIYYSITRSLYPEKPTKSLLYAILFVLLFFCAYCAHSLILLPLYQLLPYSSFSEFPLFLYICAILISVVLISFLEFLFFLPFRNIQKIWPKFRWNILNNLALALFFAINKTAFDYFVIGGIGLLGLLLNFAKKLI